MSETKFTKGPWKLETVPTQVGICHKIGPFPGSCGKEVGSACVYVDGAHAYEPQLGKEGELYANALLMTAAPDLYAACQSAVSLLRKLGGTNHDPEYTELVNALAKARGES